MSKTQAHHWPLGLFFIVILVFIDQFSKWWITERMLRFNEGYDFLSWLLSPPDKRLPYAEEAISSFFNVVMVWNEGISFGLFNGSHETMATILTIATSLIAGAFFIWMVKTENRGMAASLSLIIGGALGNIIDRVRFGAVIDFLDFHLFDIHWPAFNIADTSIVIGILFIMYDSLFAVEKKQYKKRKRVFENRVDEKDT